MVVLFFIFNDCLHLLTFVIVHFLFCLILIDIEPNQFVCFILSMLFMFVCSVKYEDPQALGGLASALDVRQQNTGGVSTLKHVVKYSFKAQI